MSLTHNDTILGFGARAPRPTGRPRPTPRDLERYLPLIVSTALAADRPRLPVQERILALSRRVRRPSARDSSERIVRDVCRMVSAEAGPLGPVDSCATVLR